MKSRSKPKKVGRVTRGGRVYWDQMRQGRACDGKVRHPDRDEAEIARIRMENATGDELKSYLCPWCHQWHIGRDHSKIGDRG